MNMHNTEHDPNTTPREHHHPNIIREQQHRNLNRNHHQNLNRCYRNHHYRNQSLHTVGRGEVSAGHLAQHVADEERGQHEALRGVRPPELGGHGRDRDGQVDAHHVDEHDAQRGPQRDDIAREHPHRKAYFNLYTTVAD